MKADLGKLAFLWFGRLPPLRGLFVGMGYYGGPERQQFAGMVFMLPMLSSCSFRRLFLTPMVYRRFSQYLPFTSSVIMIVGRVWCQYLFGRCCSVLASWC